MRKQYNFWPGSDGLLAWDVDRLIELSAGLEVEALPLSSVVELDTAYWFKDGQAPTVRAVVEHVRLMQETDLAFPVILAADGRVMDGDASHRQSAPAWTCECLRCPLRRDARTRL